jgi:glycosyltransferase involved in cell wall biosynthesis
MGFPLISVIVTTYNYAHTVGTAIESALRQDYPNFEVVVVDNASTDATPELMARYRDDARVRYVRNATNVGMVPNHNKGLAEARGTYVLFLSADDFLMPRHLSRSYAYLQAHPEVDVLYTATYFVDSNERFFAVRQMSGQPLVPYAGGRNELASLYSEGCYMCFPTMLMPRDLFDRFGPLDEEIKAADYEIVLRWAANGVRFGYEPTSTCAVRLHENQQSSTSNYIADAGDIREFVYLVKKFAGAFGAQLRDHEMSISRHLWRRFQIALNAGVRDESGEIRASMMDVDAMLARIKTEGANVPRRLHPTVIVLGSQRPAEMERTLASLVAQQHADWDAVVIEELGHSFAELGWYLDPQDRIRTYRPIGPLAEVVRINTALRIARGDVFVVVRAGNELAPAYLANVVAALATSGADAVRAAARLRIDNAGDDAIYDPFMAPNEQVLPWSALFGPIESFAFTRAALDAKTSFDERLSTFSEWEFFLRIAASLPVVAVPAAVAIVHAAAGSEETFARFSHLLPVATTIHQTYAANDPSIISAREAYVARLRALLATERSAQTTVDAIVRLYASACGGDVLAVAH